LPGDRPGPVMAGWTLAQYDETGMEIKVDYESPYDVSEGDEADLVLV